MHTARHALSPSSCTYFSLSNMKTPWKDSLHHAAEMLKSTGVVQLDLHSLKVVEMLSPLMLQLELQNMKISHYILSSNYIIKYILFIIILLLDASYFNITSLFNKHDLTNTSLMNIHINKSIYHRCTYIIWTWTTLGHIFFGNELALDMYYLDMDHC